MHFGWIDWTIVATLVVVMLGIATATKGYMKSVADFLSANRCAGRYLLAISDGMAGWGAISIVGMFEFYYVSGFSASWWKLALELVAMMVVLSGWILYRFRETRALTIGQFFELRYSKRFRIYAGFFSWVAGVVNMGIFPAVGARFFIQFFGLPQAFTVLNINISTYPFMMVVLLVIALYCVFAGGQITIIITDFVQGIFVYIVCLIVLGFFIYKFNWTTIVEGLKAAPDNASMLNPFQTDKVRDFNPWFYFVTAFTMVYATGAFQGQQSCRSTSAKSSHEAKMALIIGTWRDTILILLFSLMAIIAYAVMHHPDYNQVAVSVDQSLQVYDSATIQEQMTVPTVLSVLLPSGLLGLFAAVVLAAFISTHDTYLHSWGILFVQDVILPFRKKPFGVKQHIWLLRLSVMMVAIIIFLFSLHYEQNEHILMFQQITGSIITAGLGSAIVGGLYWKRGGASGAWLALTLGIVLTGSTMIMRSTWVDYIYPWLLSDAPGVLASIRYVIEGFADKVPWVNWTVVPEEFPINSYWMSLFIMIIAIFAYLSCSLFESYVLKRPQFDMDRLLHRGKYAVKGDHMGDVVKPVTGWRAFLPTREFSRGDKVIYYCKLFWTLFLFMIFVVGTIVSLNYDHNISEDSWAKFWLISVIVYIVLGVFTVIWLSIGGTIDARNMFRMLKSAKRDDRDMGMVIGHRSLEEIPETDQE